MSNQDLKNKIFKDSSVLLFGRLVQMLLQLINGLLIPKLISPLKYGLWRSLFIIYQYATFSNLGTLPGIFSILTVGLIYYGLIGLDIFKSIPESNLS